MLSVLYAMTGGVILQWLLGYNFSVAVWIGYIALYGVAVETGVVMVIYLHEALDRRLGAGRIRRERTCSEATREGSVLRLRPKLMTVSAAILSLLPIFWSSGAGFRSHAPDRGADRRGNDHLDGPRASRDAGHLLPVEGAGAPPRNLATLWNGTESGIEGIGRGP